MGYDSEPVPPNLFLTFIYVLAAISFSALNLDRGNLTQVNTDNFLPDLGMTTNGAFLYPSVRAELTRSTHRLQFGKYCFSSGIPHR